MPESIITPSEFAERMRNLCELSEHDEETAHGDADAMMCELLIKLGYAEGVQAFREMNKWYA